jgi:hypothetical protein
MHRSVPALAVLAAGVAAAVPLTNAGAQSPGARTVNLIEHNKGSTQGFVDNPPKMKNRRRPVFSVGDVFAGSAPVFDASDRTGLGRVHFQCTITEGGSERRAQAVCTGVYRLRDGQISLATTIGPSARDVAGAVTGGDGAYAGARGTFRSHNTRTGANDTITLLP